MANDWDASISKREERQKEQIKESVSRRKFLQRTAMLGLAAAVPGSLLTMSAMAEEKKPAEGVKASEGSIVDVPGVRVGQVSDEQALTGCTVVVLEKGSACGVDVRGSAPGTRETDLLNPINSVQEVNDANLNKVQANKIAQMAHNGLAKTINPVHTMSDGDTVFAVATGGVDASVSLVGALSVEVLAEAVVNAILSAKGAGGVPAYQDLHGKK
ncbi:P1 family peptidase [Brevibacillus centrosporus]|uniref:P1 family peptidase n=1 Tax=Brevibacillus centrosporus TaxID=54910 RepID=UPI003D193F34